MTSMKVGEARRFDHPALQQVGWLGNNDYQFYTLDQGDVCRKNNKGGYAPIYRQIGTYYFDDESKSWILND